jgi:hypothetical protein
MLGALLFMVGFRQGDPNCAAKCGKRSISTSVFLSLRQRANHLAERDEYTAGYAQVPLAALA